MKLEQLPSGSYRAQKVYKGKRYRITFDHKPSSKELTIAFAEKIQDEGVVKGTFEKYAKEYISNREGVISPATIRTYNIKLNQISDKFKKMNIYDVTSEAVQREISTFALDHAPKTTRTLYGFIASVMASYRPNLALRIKLPQAIVKQEYEPSNEDVRRILEHVQGTEYSIPFQLAVLGCRRGEICAADISDLRGNELWIHRSKVYLNGEWITKDFPKTDASNRILYLPPKLADEIRERGHIYENYPAALLKALNRTQDKLGIHRFKFHALRSYFASYAHSIGIPDADIMAIGGWQTDHVMKKIYRKSLEESKQKSMDKITNNIWG